MMLCVLFFLLDIMKIIRRERRLGREDKDMAKYKAQVGGFVTVFRQRTVTVYADTEAEARI